jgi:Domain of unknown function (DUF4157)
VVPRVQRLSPEAVHAYVHVPTLDAERARVVVVPWLTPGVAAMTLGPWILVRRGRDHDAGLIAHELVHVQQWREHGAVLFLARYLAAYLRGRLRGEPHWTAYASIPFEAEARARAGA